MSPDFSRFAAAVRTKLTREDREAWREQFASAVISLAVSSRDALLDELHVILPRLGMPEGLRRLGAHSTRAVFLLPFDLVMKLEVNPLCFSFQDGWLLTHGFHEETSGNFTEVERAKQFPNLLPRTYGQCLRLFDHASQTINLLIAERLIPLQAWLESATQVLRTPLEEFAVNPRSGQLMIMDAGGLWSYGAENQLEDGLKVEESIGTLDRDALLGFGECLFRQFGASAVGARYAANLDDLRQVFGDHLLRFAGVCSSSEDFLSHLAEFALEDHLTFDDRPFAVGERRKAYRLPFDLVAILGTGRIAAPKQLRRYGQLYGSAKRKCPQEVVYPFLFPVPSMLVTAKGTVVPQELNNARRRKVTASLRRGLSLMVVEDPRGDPSKAAELERIVNARPLQ